MGAVVAALRQQFDQIVKMIFDYDINLTYNLVSTQQKTALAGAASVFMPTKGENSRGNLE